MTGRRRDDDETGIEQLRRDAQFYLGKREDELNDLVRVGPIGDVRMALSEDYRVGRITVGLDNLDGDGTTTVTTAIVEFPDGPKNFDFGEQNRGIPWLRWETTPTASESGWRTAAGMHAASW